MTKKNYDELTDQIIEFVGGKENISQLWHCVTRLRFSLRDKSLLKEDVQIPNTLGIQWMGEQLQIIIGQHVTDVYEVICKKTGIAAQAGIDEKLDDFTKQDTKSVKGVLKIFVAKIADSFVPIIPAIVLSSFVSLIATICGPTMLNVMSEQSDIYRMLTLVGNVGFYFLPIFMGMTAAKTFRTSQILGVFIGGVLLHPSLTAIVSAGESFTVYGIPMTLVSYASSTLPVFLSVWCMSYIEKFFKRYCPDGLKMVLVPLGTILVMLPITLCIIGPFGTWIGNVLADLIVLLSSFGNIPRILTGTILAGFWIFAIVAGMHIPIYLIALTIMTANGGADNLIIPATCCSVSALLGMEIGAALKARKAENKSLAISYIITHAVGGITEPALFGIGLRYGKPLLCTCFGGACGALFIMITGATVYTVVATSNLLMVTSFAGASMTNFVLGAAGQIIAVIVAAITTYIFGFKDTDY